MCLHILTNLASQQYIASGGCWHICLWHMRKTSPLKEVQQLTPDNVNSSNEI